MGSVHSHLRISVEHGDRRLSSGVHRKTKKKVQVRQREPRKGPASRSLKQDGSCTRRASTRSADRRSPREIGAGLAEKRKLLARRDIFLRPRADISLRVIADNRCRGARSAKE